MNGAAFATLLFFQALPVLLLRYLLCILKVVLRNNLLLTDAGCLDHFDEIIICIIPFYSRWHTYLTYIVLLRDGSVGLLWLCSQLIGVVVLKLCIAVCFDMIDSQIFLASDQCNVVSRE